MDRNTAESMALSSSEFISQLLSISKNIVWKDTTRAYANEVQSEAINTEIFIAACKGILSFDTVYQFSQSALEKAGLSGNALYSAMDNKMTIPESLRPLITSVFISEQTLKDPTTGKYVNYTEYNNYYRMLNGLPNMEDKDFIYNTKYDDIPKDIPIHELSLADRYTLEARGYLDELLAKYTDKKYQYIKYLSSKCVDIYEARVAERFSILYITNDLSISSKLKEDFEDCYNMCRRTVSTVYYSEGFKKNNDLYDNFMALCILFMTVQMMHYKYLSADISRDFYDLESIKYIYDAYGVPFYKSIPLEYHRKIVKSINRLLSYKGSTRVFYELFNLFDYGTMDVFEYYLLKLHKFDENGVPIFAYTKGTETWKFNDLAKNGFIFNELAYGNATYVAAGVKDETINYIWSKDFTEWTEGKIPSMSIVNDVIFYNKFVAVGDKGTICTSGDGTTWTERVSNVTEDLVSVTRGNDYFIALGKTKIISISKDGINWSALSLPNAGTYNAIGYGNNMYYVVGNNGIIYSSKDGKTWILHESGTTENLNDIVITDDSVVIVGDNGTILTDKLTARATSLTSLTPIPPITTENIKSVTYANNAYVFTGSKGLVILSYDLNKFEIKDANTKIHDFLCSTYAAGRFVTIGSPGGYVFESEVDSYDNEAMFDIKFGKVKLYDDPALELSDTANHVSYDSMVLTDPYWISDYELTQKMYNENYNYLESKYLGIETVFDMMKIVFETCYLFKMITDKRSDLANVAVQYNSINREIPIFTLIMYISALVCKKYGYEGNISSELPFVSKVMGFNFKEGLTKIREAIKNNEYLRKDTYLDSLLIGMDVNSLNSINNTFAKIDNLRKYFAEKVSSSRTREEFFAYYNLEKMIMYSDAIDSSFRKSNGALANSFADFVKDLDPELYLRITSNEVDVDEELNNVLVLLKQNINSLKYIEYADGIDISIMIEHLFKLLKFFKSAKAELTGYNIVYTLSTRGLNYIKFISEITKEESKITIEDQFIWLTDLIEMIYDYTQYRSKLLYLMDKIDRDEHYVFIKDQFDILTDKIVYIRNMYEAMTIHLDIRDIVAYIFSKQLLKSMLQVSDKAYLAWDKVDYYATATRIKDNFEWLIDMLWQINDKLTVKDKMELNTDIDTIIEICYGLFKRQSALNLEDRIHMYVSNFYIKSKFSLIDRIFLIATIDVVRDRLIFTDKIKELYDTIYIYNKSLVLLTSIRGIEDISTLKTTLLMNDKVLGLEDSYRKYTVDRINDMFKMLMDNIISIDEISLMKDKTFHIETVFEKATDELTMKDIFLLFDDIVHIMKTKLKDILTLEDKINFIKDIIIYMQTKLDMSDKLNEGEITSIIEDKLIYHETLVADDIGQLMTSMFFSEKILGLDDGIANILFYRVRDNIDKLYDIINYIFETNYVKDDIDLSCKIEHIGDMKSYNDYLLFRDSLHGKLIDMLSSILEMDDKISLIKDIVTYLKSEFDFDSSLELIEFATSIDDDLKMIDTIAEDDIVQVVSNMIFHEKVLGLSTDIFTVKMEWIKDKLNVLIDFINASYSSIILKDNIDFDTRVTFISSNYYNRDILTLLDKVRTLALTKIKDILNYDDKLYFIMQVIDNYSSEFGLSDNIGYIESAKYVVDKLSFEETYKLDTISEIMTRLVFSDKLFGLDDTINIKQLITRLKDNFSKLYGAVEAVSERSSYKTYFEMTNSYSLETLDRHKINLNISDDLLNKLFDNIRSTFSLNDKLKFIEDYIKFIYSKLILDTKVDRMELASNFRDDIAYFDSTSSKEITQVISNLLYDTRMIDFYDTASQVTLDKIKDGLLVHVEELSRNYSLRLQILIEMINKLTFVHEAKVILNPEKLLLTEKYKWSQMYTLGSTINFHQMFNGINEIINKYKTMLNLIDIVYKVIDSLAFSDELTYFDKTKLYTSDIIADALKLDDLLISDYEDKFDFIRVMEKIIDKTCLFTTKIAYSYKLYDNLDMSFSDDIYRLIMNYLKIEKEVIPIADSLMLISDESRNAIKILLEASFKNNFERVFTTGSVLKFGEKFFNFKEIVDYYQILLNMSSSVKVIKRFDVIKDHLHFRDAASGIDIELQNNENN